MRGWASVSIFMDVDFGLFGSYMGGVFYIMVFSFRRACFCLVSVLVVHGRRQFITEPKSTAVNQPQ